MSQHRSQLVDFEEYKWLLKHGNTEVWYTKPDRVHLKMARQLEGTGREPPELVPLLNPQPIKIETPKVLASPPLTTPTDDDIYDCTAGHSAESGLGTCHQCSEERSEALDRTSLVYCSVYTTTQTNEHFTSSISGGQKIYKMMKCGSREAAVTEAFYAAGVEACNLVFSCVMRFGEDFEERNGPIKRVDELWMLAEEEKDSNTIRVFY